MNRQSLAAGLAFAAVLGVGMVVGDDFLPHTDDGCTVEIHCFACRLSVAATTTQAPVVSLPLVLVAAEAVTPPEPAPLPEPHRSTKPPRGPPALSHV